MMDQLFEFEGDEVGTSDTNSEHKASRKRPVVDEQPSRAADTVPSTRDELAAMSVATDALEPLSESARHRVVRWLSDVYGTGSAAGTGAEVRRQHPHEPKPQDPAPNNATFDTFAELFDALGPRDDDERVLAAMYWRLTHDDEAQTDSFHVNKALKDLGHAVDRVRNVLPRLQGTKPALVLQVSHGKGASGRRIVKLSLAGVRRIEAALAAGGFEKVK